ncbi:MAG: hypothetical protein AAGC76_02150 [Luteibacter sp.]|uniref:hypothetical protein n=1 Tax=Luteibacter TaxID=242605 RepID=UPI000AA51586|nr:MULTISPECIES: hypothetical protein [unclassified Luteibacter]MDQ7994635.1 hypothetical protein [Luteibacter sp.]MDQ8048208.1 hypothetical protein [Luteibacter sp.]MDR6641877.1 hypothetical protein [Luteibacter sp. 1214]
MSTENKLFVYDEDGLFDIVDSTKAEHLSGGIQSSIGLSTEAVSGVFCHNKDSCS